MCLLELRAGRERDLGTKQTALPDKKFGVIVADPEWRFEPWSRSTGMDRAADNHYPTSCTEVIAARDVPSIAADDCVLWLWATAPMCWRTRFSVMAAWGFDYQAQTMSGTRGVTGTGYWNRNAARTFAGSVSKAKSQHQHQARSDRRLSRRRVEEHSAKPQMFLEMIEQYFPTLPKIELNRRAPAREGWSCLGQRSHHRIRCASSRGGHGYVRSTCPS